MKANGVPNAQTAVSERHSACKAASACRKAANVVPLLKCPRGCRSASQNAHHFPEKPAAMNSAQLIDPTSAAIVVGGTLVATFLRCGIGDVRAAVGALAALARNKFDARHAKAELAIQVREIRQDGFVRAAPHHFGDSEFDDVTDALIETRRIDALHAAHARHRAIRAETSERAIQALLQAAELAPVFGLAGTLVSLSQLRVDGAVSDLTGAIGMAVLTTLYGLLLGNLVFAPLARLVERAAQAEERERQQLVDWLEAELVDEMPGARAPVRRAPAGAAA
jgi:chemotaxis protein MotA